MTRGHHRAAGDGARRAAALAALAAIAVTVSAAVALGVALALPAVEDLLLALALMASGLGLALAASRIAFSPRADLPPASAPKRPVLLCNPRAGGGKVARFNVADEARARGIEALELEPDEDLEQLARDAVARGADAIGVAGGDGSQAAVAAVAAEEGLPYVCVPAGTRNHFALDLGVDRGDIIGALDAFAHGGERVVDLAEVNGRPFVNNVSLGVFGEAVNKPGYRAAKVRTVAGTMPALVGPGGHPVELDWTDFRGDPHASADVLLVSNDPYRLGPPRGAATRPRLDRGVLGIAAVGLGPNGRRAPGDRLLEWSTASFEVGAARPVAAAIDGEAVTLEPPLRFTIRPRALRVRIAPGHPGASPSASLPRDAWHALPALARMALRGAR